MKQLFWLLSTCLFCVSVSYADNLVYGDNTSPNANNGICDDPRFEGRKASNDPQLIDRFHDANDCRDLYQQGLITLAGTDGIDFGDNSGSYTNDGECDDPRFVGSGASSAGTAGTDANDCREQYALGNIRLREQPKVVPLYLADGSINFGDDTGNYPNDDDCDDPRFAGPGTTAAGDYDDIGGDKTDCMRAYRNGEAFINPTVASNLKNIDRNIDFGDDSGGAALDGECDDRRFSGDLVYDSSSEKTDATDCRVLYLSGLISVFVEPELYLPDGSINFGDDSGTYAEDGECDDNRFAGPGASSLANREHVAKDRTDCERAYRNGEIYLKSESQTEGVYDGIDFGNNQSAFAFDDECDDPRFSGSGASSLSSDSHRLADAADCIAAYKMGTIRLTDQSNQFDNIVFDNIDFGNNSGAHADDGECDDPRFDGPGSSNLGLAGNSYLKADANDCVALYKEGRVYLDGGNPVDSSIDFGSNESSYAFDGECDDPRFEGPGMASFLSDNDLKKDAFDCRELMEAGRISLKATRGKGATNQTPASGVDFGNDSSLWANDGVCDDPRFVGEGMAGSLDDSNARRDATDCRQAYEAQTIRLR
ncbi:hypothetical protein [Salinibius halmophilus]|uniref:hypothetical protein n=1 Tax=Salinibius halmophilus TaxID=1853216 RepID=UPI000E662064|nr:hypothetical protein [Salinibius halmophilus]